jgi:tRNA threonylcarbamoyladenosine biosynthesis protein TsaB
MTGDCTGEGRMDEPALLIETSGRGGAVGLAFGTALHTRHLDPARRHARDLAPAIAGLLAEAGLTPRDVKRVGVSVGPGSFTGLRVGIMSAKAFAYATGCELVAVPTFAALAEMWANPATTHLHVVADGLQGMIYHEGFERTPAGWKTFRPLSLMSIADEWRVEGGGWLGTVSGVTGLGSGLVEHTLPNNVPGTPLAAPSLEAMRAVAGRLAALSRDEMLALEPLYLRGSSAEEKAARDGRP